MGSLLQSRGRPAEGGTGGAGRDFPRAFVCEKDGGLPATRDVVAGSGAHARLSESGERLMRLLIWPD